MTAAKSTTTVQLTGSFVGLGRRGDVVELDNERLQGFLDQEFAIEVLDDEPLPIAPPGAAPLAHVNPDGSVVGSDVVDDTDEH